MGLSGPAAATGFWLKRLLGCCWNGTSKLMSPRSVLQAHRICGEHTGTCVMQTTLVLTSISTLVAITMLPGEDPVVLGQPKRSGNGIHLVNRE